MIEIKNPKIELLHDLSTKFNPLEKRAGIFFSDYEDDYSVIYELVPNIHLARVLDHILKDPNFSNGEEISLYKYYNGFLAYWWNSILKKELPKKENTTSHLVNIIIKENMIYLLEKHKYPLEFFINQNGDYNKKRELLYRTQAYDKYNLSFLVKNKPKLAQQLVEGAKKDVKILEPYNRKNLEEFYLLEMRHYRKLSKFN